MKKLRTIALLAVIPLMMSSCVISYYHATTGNPVGNKQGIAKGKLVGNFDGGIGAAAKNGGITKIGLVDAKFYMSGRFKVTVSGD
jgi:hypothetical protein